MDEVRTWAGVQGFLSLAAVITLILFYVLGSPLGAQRGQWLWLGPANDWLSVFGSVSWVVAMVLIAREVRAGVPLWILTIAACVAVGALAVVTVLQVAGVVGLQAQFAAAIPVVVFGFGWLPFAAAAAHATGHAPRGILVFASVLAAALLVGLVLAGTSFLAADPSALRNVLLFAGIGIGGLSWVAFPVWWLTLAAAAQ